MTEYSGSSDPTLSMKLLWGLRDAPTRGHRPALDLHRIVTAAIGVADTEGLGALSMRKVAERLGAGTMSLYRYVPGKAELLDLMTDTAYGEMLHKDGHEDSHGDSDGDSDQQRGGSRPPEEAPGTWRERLEHTAHRYRAMYLRHPWILQIAVSRPPLGPNVIAAYERDLAAVEGIGLSDLEMDSVITLLVGFVASSARGALDVALAEQRTGLTDRQWWEAHAPLLEQVFDPAVHPLAARVGAAAGEAQQAAYDPGRVFEFGLARILDGVAALIEP